MDFIIDEGGRVISYPYLPFNGYQMKSRMNIKELIQESGYFDKKNIIVNTYKDTATEWIYCNVYDRDYILKDISRSQTLQYIHSVAVSL